MKKYLRQFIKSSFGVSNFTITKFIERGNYLICIQEPIITRSVGSRNLGLIGISRDRTSILSAISLEFPQIDLDLLEVERYREYYIVY